METINKFQKETGYTLEKRDNGYYYGGSLNLRDTAITSLPDNLTVGGSLYLNGTSITSLPDNLTVGGSLYLRGISITDGNKWSHGSSLKDANEDLLYKISNRDTSKWTFKIIMPDELSSCAVSDKNVGKISLFLAREVEKIISKPHPEIDEDTRSSLIEIANNFYFLHSLSKMSYSEREHYEMHEEELWEHLDYELNELYDIGDYNKLIWVQLL